MKFREVAYPVAVAGLLASTACAPESAEDVTVVGLEWEAPSRVEQTDTLTGNVVCHPTEIGDWSSGRCGLPYGAYDIERGPSAGCVDIELEGYESKTYEDAGCGDRLTYDLLRDEFRTQERGRSFIYSYRVDEVRTIAGCVASSRELKAQSGDSTLARLPVERCIEFGGAEELPRTRVIDDPIKFLVYLEGEDEEFELRADEELWQEIITNEPLDIKHQDGKIKCYKTSNNDC